jgi:TonB family protein
MYHRIITAAAPLALGVLLTVVLLTYSSSVRAQETPTAAYEPKSLPGRAIYPHDDFYPAQARRLGITGRVCLAYSVDTKGHAQHVEVLVSGGALLDDPAKKLLANVRFQVPSDWVATGGPAKRYRQGVVFNLTNKPEVPPFEDSIPTAVVTVTGIPGS